MAGIALLFLPTAPTSYAAAGDLDPTFGWVARWTADLTSKPDFPWSVAWQADGRIVAAGESDVGGFNPKFGVARLNPDGTQTRRSPGMARAPPTSPRRGRRLRRRGRGRREDRGGGDGRVRAVRRGSVQHRRITGHHLRPFRQGHRRLHLARGLRLDHGRSDGRQDRGGRRLGRQERKVRAGPI